RGTLLVLFVAASIGLRATLPFAAAQKLEVVDRHLVLRALLSRLLVVPRVQSQAALNQQRPALLAVLVDDLRLLPESRTVDEHDLLTVFAGGGLVPMVDGQTDIDHRRLARQLAQLGVAREVAHENDAV